MDEKILVIQTDPGALAGQDRSFFRKFDVHNVNEKADVQKLCRTSRNCVIVVAMEGPNDLELALLREIKVVDCFDRPLIAITNHNSMEIEQAIASIGVFYHLLSPFDPDDLNDLVNAAVRSWKSKFHGPAPFSVFDQAAN